MKTHRLKTLERFFEKVASGEKKFEIRRDDRCFQRGDRLHLIEVRDFNAAVETGRSLYADVTFVTNFQQKDDYVVMSINVVQV